MIVIQRGFFRVEYYIIFLIIFLIFKYFKIFSSQGPLPAARPGQECRPGNPQCTEQCVSVPEEKCETKYNPECRTINDRKCETVYEDKERIQTGLTI